MYDNLIALINAEWHGSGDWRHYTLSWDNHSAKIDLDDNLRCTASVTFTDGETIRNMGTLREMYYWCAGSIANNILGVKNQ